MADAITIQALQDASLDAKSLEEVVNGNESKQVTTRKGETYPSVKKALTQMFENGGLPATPFATKALMTASALVDGKYAQVTDDTVNNGLYIKTAGVWVKSNYDPVGISEKKINELQKSIYGIVTIPWELGTFTEDGSIYPATNRARKTGGFLFAPNMKVQISSNNPNIQVRIILRNENGSVYFASNYTTASEAIIPFEYNFVVKNADNSPVDLALVKSAVSVKLVPAVDILKETVNKNTERHDDLVKLINGGDIKLGWENGSIDEGGNAWSLGVANRIRTKPFKNFLVGNLTLDNTVANLKYKVTTYDHDGVLVNYRYTWDEENINTVVVDGFYSIVAAKKDDTPLAPSDGKIAISYTTKNTKNLEKRLMALLLTGEYPAAWESGSYASNGLPYPQASRLRMSEGKKAFRGALEAKSNNPDQSINLVKFDTDGAFIGYGDFSSSINAEINGYFDIVVKWNDDRTIKPSDAEVSVRLSSGGGSTTKADSLSIDIPRYSSVPYGYLLGKPLAELETAFDGEVSKYQGATLKESIGMTTDGLHEMFAYTLTPLDYTTTIAITMHTHGNERWNPLGFFALLNEMSKQGTKHPYIKWLKDNVRWYVVPFASPTAVKNYSRGTGGTNLNRNYDFMWSDGASDKGTAVYSLNESRNIAAFFKPKKQEIDYHLDLHDIPEAFAEVSHRPANLSKIAFRDEQNEMRNHLSSINGESAGGIYSMDAGGTGNFFMGVLGIPSTTPEHITQHWLNKGLSNDQQIAKALEQTCGFLYMFTHMLTNRTYKRGSAYYTRDHEVSFCSIEYGISTWTTEDLATAFGKVGFLTKKIGDFTVFSNTPKPEAKTILVLSGTTLDDNNSDLTVLRVVERIDAGDEMYLEHLKNSNLVVAPSLAFGGASESVIGNRIQGLIAEYQPDYTLLVSASGLMTASGASVARSNVDDNFTAMTISSDVVKSNEIVGYDAKITGRYTSLFLGSDAAYYSIYPHNVAKWVGLVANDLASYYSEIINN